MSKSFKGLLVNKEQAKVMTFKGTLEEYYELLNCEFITIVDIKFGDKYYDVICDEEATLKPVEFFSICSSSGAPMIAGNIIVCNHNYEGEETSLTRHDVTTLYKHLAWSTQNEETVPVLVADI